MTEYSIYVGLVFHKDSIGVAVTVAGRPHRAGGHGLLRNTFSAQAQ